MKSPPPPSPFVFIIHIQMLFVKLRSGMKPDFFVQNCIGYILETFLELLHTVKSKKKDKEGQMDSLHSCISDRDIALLSRSYKFYFAFCFF